MVVSHFCIVVSPSSFAEITTFYRTILAPLGYTEFRSAPQFLGLMPASGIPDFFIIAKEGRGPTKDAHFGFRAKDQEEVAKWHAVAL